MLQSRQVALKLPHGAWRRAGLAERMAREREILATLEHPNIARLYDAGLADDGQPYLALEYVDGERIDAYCRTHALDVRRRLGLFVQVCKAVAYAHTNLVVHRDLKPSNILVTATGQVRLLDFGIAKLLEHGVAQATELTRESGQALTPEYAAPEQILAQPVTTASDVYSLGVVLYELLTDQRPYKLRRESRGLLEEAILQAQPSLPSSVVSDAKLRRQLRGDLDTIVLMALKKAPEERYGTVDALVDDIERHLANREVIARADTLTYRIGRFVARNRLAVSAATIVVLAVLCGAGLATWQARLAQAEQRRAEEVKEFIASIFRNANPYADEGRVVSAGELLERARAQIDLLGKSQPELRVELLNIVAASLMGIGNTDTAETVGQQALGESERLLGAEHAQTVAARLLMADVHRFRGRTVEMGRELAALGPVVARHAGERPGDLVRTLNDGAHLAVDEGRHEEAVLVARRALDVATVRLGEQHPATAAAATILAEASMILADGRMSSSADRGRMLETADRSLDLVRRAYPGQPRHPQVLEMRAVHGRALARAGFVRRGVAELLEVLDDQRQAFGATSMAVTYTAGNVASQQRKIGDLAGALQNHDSALGLLSKHVIRDSYTYAVNLLERGVTLLAARRPEAALADLSTATRTLPEDLLGPTHFGTLTAQFNQAVALAYLGRFDEASVLLAPLRERPSEIKGLMWASHVQGIVQRLAGEYEAAEQSQRTALGLVPVGLNGHWDELRILAELGIVQVELSRNDDAIRTLARVQKLSGELSVAPSPMTTDAQIAHGRARLALGEALNTLPELVAADRYWSGFAPDSRWAGYAALSFGTLPDALGRAAGPRCLCPRRPRTGAIAGSFRASPRQVRARSLNSVLQGHRTRRPPIRDARRNSSDGGSGSPIVLDRLGRQASHRYRQGSGDLRTGQATSSQRRSISSFGKTASFWTLPGREKLLPGLTDVSKAAGADQLLMAVTRKSEVVGR